MRKLLYSGFLLCGACTSPTTAMEDNDLGVATLETHVVGDTFELDALTAHGDTIATVTRRVGIVEGLLPDRTDTIGSEVILSIGGETARGISFETAMLAMPPMDAPFKAFLDLPSVTSVLAREGKMHVYIEPPVTAQTPDSAYGTSQCPSSKLVANGVVAQQCCYATASSYGPGHTLFRRAQGDVSFRQEGTTTCSDPWGGHACMFAGDPPGSDCFIGPNGFSKASFWRFNTYVRIAPNFSTFNDVYNGAPPSYTLCQDTWSSSPMSDYFGSVTGTSPMGSCGQEPNYIWGY